MLIDTATDGHVHTFLCHHARGTMENYVEAALDRKLRKIIFLEHMEAGVSYFESTWLDVADFEFYRSEGRRLQEKYQGRIQIGLGVEVGYNPRRREDLVAFLARHRWDRIGISYHFLEVGGRHYNVVSKRRENLVALAEVGIEKVVSDYFAGLLEAVNSLPGTVLCHLDAVLRHHPQVCFGQTHRRQIDEIFAAMRRRGMALEVNTSGIPLRGQPFPAVPLLQQAVALGIPLAAGSDAHRPQDVGRQFEQLPRFLG
jgi:histidinol-phosphatase (PHP family)